MTQNQSCANLVTRENGLEIGKESTESISTTGQIIQPQAQLGLPLCMLAWAVYGSLQKVNTNLGPLERILLPSQI